MKVFISWSGEFSNQFAEVLRDWIKCTLQATEPWISSKDLDKGAIWFSDIHKSLEETRIGILCLTKDNKEKPWLLFEAGALAKGIATNRVCPILFNLEPKDIKGPLAQFNHTLPNKEGMFSLLLTINKELGENKLPEKILEDVFAVYWDSFNEKITEIMKEEPNQDIEYPERTENDMLEEILYATRKMDKKIQELEEKSISSSSSPRNKGIKSSNYELFKNSILMGLKDDVIKKNFKVTEDELGNIRTFLKKDKGFIKS
ncbi:toll/interleukin-1 receptor domain-containing protein [Poseidonibacter lekithochrous]|uniref:toll/interleukin-1 receptor domain-containing protein n=1 Tax=Poseidonibacter TaxID=2321187 RepID=UPI001C09B597|nr:MULTISPECIES: toll/interleukin-1 receptor domain-containing protein [Poseidonibacter]MBU3015659.1 toll/interleukin-1 receptor domain-containing protein [Poseidonibacter lekithochrous]MDO6828960.1 toll/interleukin-1 receptor domain-containing protein [Poseidonibacter sp. 1_MG-2023]